MGLQEFKKEGQTSRAFIRKNYFAFKG